MPSGQTFEVVFQSATAGTDGPYRIYEPPNWTATPPAASVARAATARAGLRYGLLAKPKHAVKLIESCQTWCRIGLQIAEHIVLDDHQVVTFGSLQ